MEDAIALHIPSLLIDIPRTGGQLTFTLRPPQGGQRLDNRSLDRNGDGLFDGQTLIIDLHYLIRALEDLTRVMYIGPFRNALDLASDASYFDIDVGRRFIEHWREYQAGSNLRHRQEASKLEEDIRHLFGWSALDIRTSSTARTLIIDVDGYSYTLQELGAGLAQFILVLANAAWRRPSFILIDEPEANLHPSLQLDFLTSLGAFATKGLLFATHSIGLARSAANPIYSVQRTGPGTSRVSALEATPHLSELLSRPGVKWLFRTFGGGAWPDIREALVV